MRINKSWFVYIIGLILAIQYGEVSGQSIGASQGQGPFIQFQTYNQLIAGDQSQGNIQVGISPSSTRIPNWKLTIQVGAPIAAGGSSTTLSPQYISLRFNQQLASNPTIAGAIGAPQTAIPLSSAEVILINNAAYALQAPPDYYFTLRYDILIQGGQHLVDLQNGNYICNLIFRLYDAQGVLRSTSTTDYNFGRWFFGEIPPSGGSIEVQPNARVVTLDFSSRTNYNSGVVLSLSDGLKVRSQAGYQLKVKCSTTNFTTTTGSVIPVDAVKIESSSGTSAPSGVTHYQLNLSNTDQTLFTKTGTTNPNSTFFNLRYFTTAGDRRFVNALAGSYTTTVVFTLQPL